MLDITKKYTTVGGLPVRLVSCLGSSLYPIVGYIDSETFPTCWTGDGHHDTKAARSAFDLVEVKTKKEGWVGVYNKGMLSQNRVGCTIHATKAHADAFFKQYDRSNGLVDVVKIEWEE